MNLFSLAWIYCVTVNTKVACVVLHVRSSAIFIRTKVGVDDKIIGFKFCRELRALINLTVIFRCILLTMTYLLINEHTWVLLIHLNDKSSCLWKSFDVWH